ncbi:HipA N-terminal domain-containing protein [Desertivirga arenae]|uniref:HipA N-terminal domain-containing protein n=1 Tax=Desertivirga arenae TaxID=2810309 RepID=UPI001A9729B9|nr:HipA N-terminal domain-containing protein [Pedobacter sp. SYSU D00823]
MTNKAKIYYEKELAGYLLKTDRGYTFIYDEEYLAGEKPRPVSLTLPLSPYPQYSNTLFAFFDGLIPEGWLLNLAKDYYRIRTTDRFELLITLCRDTIGAVTVIPVEEEIENG